MLCKSHHGKRLLFQVHILIPGSTTQNAFCIFQVLFPSVFKLGERSSFSFESPFGTLDSGFPIANGIRIGFLELDARKMFCL